MTSVESELGSCQVRIGTKRPCPRPAVTEVLGVPFCEQCAEEQRGYFTIGEITRSYELAGAAKGFLNEPLADALNHMRREFAGERRATTRITRT